MTIWFAFALMTAAAVFAVLWPLGRRGATPGGSDLAVYRDQLDEITRDQAAGQIGEAEAEAAKVEVSRRLIAAADAAETRTSESGQSPLWRRRLTALAGLLLLPIGATALYLALGSPQMPGQPLAVRQSESAKSANRANSTIETMIAQVEGQIARNPDDGRAWEVLAPVYMRLNRLDDAVKAFRNSLRLNGSNAAREADLGEALVFAANGIVTPEAKSQFDRALALDGQDVMARFYLGMAADQAGRRAEAETIWRDLLAKAPPGAPWVEMVRHAMERKSPAGTPSIAAAAGVPGPSSGDVAAASKLNPDQTQHEISSMVARLANRLKQDGSDAAGWAQLVRSYRVMGQNDKAQSAIADARRALAGDPEKLRAFAEAAEETAPAALAVPSAPQAPPASAAPGPSAADIAAASKLNPSQQNQMIVGMVARLADRLKQNGNDIEGWQRLLRAYMVLGERDKAQAAAADAKKALASDPDKLRQIGDMIKSMGLEG